MSVIDLTDFSGGINNNVAPHLVALNQSPLAVNMSLDESGAIGMRTGSRLFGSAISGLNSIQGAGTYIKEDGTHEALIVAEGNLYKYDTSSSDWTSVASSVVDTSSTVEFANFLGNIYFIGSGDTEYLKKYDGSSVSTVTGNIAGKYITSDRDYLVVGGTDQGGRRVYFSEVQLESFAALDYFDLFYPLTGLSSFGEQVPFLAFDNQTLYVVDIARLSRNPIRGFGCESHRSIKILHGYAIWVNREGFWMFRTVDPYPTKISLAIENNLRNAGLFNKIQGSNFPGIAAGTFRNKYYASVGNLSNSIEGETLNDCWFEFDITKNTWMCRTYENNGAGAVMFEYQNSSGEQHLFAGSRDDNTVYKIDVDDVYTDDDATGVAQNYTGIFKTKHMMFAGGSRYGAVGRETEKNLNPSQVKLYNEDNVSVKYNFDNATSYSTLTTITDTTPSGLEAHYQVLNPPGPNKMKALSFEFRSDQNFIVYEFNLDIYAKETPELRAI